MTLQYFICEPLSKSMVQSVIIQMPKGSLWEVISSSRSIGWSDHLPGCSALIQPSSLVSGLEQLRLMVKNGAC